MPTYNIDSVVTYANRGTNLCPVCRSPHIEWMGEIERAVSGHPTKDVENVCLECQSTWTDRWRFYDYCDLMVGEIQIPVAVRRQRGHEFFAGEPEPTPHDEDEEINLLRRVLDATIGHAEITLDSTPEE